MHVAEGEAEEGVEVDGEGEMLGVEGEAILEVVEWMVDGVM
jgi:hypothetical protein